LAKYPKGAWSTEARQGVVIALHRNEKDQEAEKICRADLSRLTAGSNADDDMLEVMTICADLFAIAGQWTNAEPLYASISKHLNDTTESAWIVYQMARASQFTKRPTQASEYFERVVKSGSDPLLTALASHQLRDGGPTQ
jgi:hypothetical protein